MSAVQALNSSQDALIKKEDEIPGPVDSVKTILKLSWWPIIGQLCHPVYTIVNAAVCGRLGGNALAGFGLGSLTLGICALSIGVCFAMAVQTLMGQAYGAGDFRMCRVYLYRQYFLNSVLFPLICIPLLFIKSIYLAIGQDPAVADLGAQYVWTVLPGIYFYM